MVGGDGYIYEGRGWGKEGAYAKGYNKKSVGIGFIGIFFIFFNFGFIFHINQHGLIMLKYR